MRPRRKAAAAVGLGVLFLAIGMTVWLAGSISRGRTKMERGVLALRAELAARDATRPPLTGKTEDGDAWDEYTVAFRAVTATGGEDLLEKFALGREGVGRGAVEPLLRSLAPALAALHRGAHRSRSVVPVRWELGYEFQFPSLQEGKRLLHLARSNARILLEDGQPRAAAEVLLDVCQLSRDYGYNTSFATVDVAAHMLLQPALDGLKVVISSPATGSAELREIERALEILEAGQARDAHLLMNEAMTIGYTVLRNWDAPGPGMESGEIRPGWKHLFSSRLQQLSAFETLVPLFRRKSARETACYMDVVVFQEEMQTLPEAAENPVIGLWVDDLLGGRNEIWITRARMRMLRIAAHWRATDEVLDLPDPFGTRFSIMTSAASLRVSSKAEGLRMEVPR
jgi:hypothetical protein